MVLVCYLSLAPGMETPLEFDYADKLCHFGAYLWLSALPFFGFGRGKQALAGALLMIPLGIVLECIQAFVPGRFFSGADMLANSLGVLLGILATLKVKTFLRHSGR